MLEHPFQEKKSQSQNSIQHFEFSDARYRLGKVQSNAEIIPSFIMFVVVEFIYLDIFSNRSFRGKTFLVFLSSGRDHFSKNHSVSFNTFNTFVLFEMIEICFLLC